MTTSLNQGGCLLKKILVVDAMFENTGATQVYLIPSEQLMGQKRPKPEH